MHWKNGVESKSRYGRREEQRNEGKVLEFGKEVTTCEKTEVMIGGGTMDATSRLALIKSTDVGIM